MVIEKKTLGYGLEFYFKDEKYYFSLIPLTDASKYVLSNAFWQ